MGCEVCKCDSGLSNTGTACSPIMQVAKKVIFVPYYNNDGDVNTIDLSSFTGVKAEFDALVNAADKSERWFPLPEMKNVEDVREDNRLESFNDGSSVFISEGNRSFMGLLVKGSAVLKAKIESARCVSTGVFIVDKDGNLIGASNATGYLSPIKIEEASVSAKLVKTTDTTLQKLEVRFEFHADEADESLRMIACSEMTYDLLQIQGLLDIYMEILDIQTDEMTVKLYTDYGTVLNPVVDKGLVKADFTLYNDSTPAAVVIIDSTESPDGTYLMTFAAQTPTDVMFLTPSKNGRDYTAVAATVITVP